MGRLALVGSRSDHVGDMFELMIFLFVPVKASKDLRQRDAGCFDGLEFKIVVHGVTVDVEVTDVVHREAQVFVAAVVGSGAVLQPIAPGIRRHGLLPVRFKLFSGIQTVLLSAQLTEGGTRRRVRVVFRVPIHRMRPPLLLLFLSAACAAWHSSASRSR